MGNIYYRIGDGPIKKIGLFTPLTRVFSKEDLKNNIYKARDDITYIHFDKAIRDGQIITPPRAEVFITIDKKSEARFSFSGNNITIKEMDDEGKEILKIQSDKVEEILIEGSELNIIYANNTIIEGNINFNDLFIITENLEFKDVVVDAKLFYHQGHRLVFNKVNGSIDFSSMDAENITIESSSLKSRYLNINCCYKPSILNSWWYLSSSLYYINESIRHKNGIAIDDKTFSGKESIDLGRAYLTYCLKRVLEKTEEINNEELISKIVGIDSDIKRLKQQYEKKVENLEDKRDIIENGYQKRRVKSIMPSNNN